MEVVGHGRCSAADEQHDDDRRDDRGGHHQTTLTLPPIEADVGDGSLVRVGERLGVDEVGPLIPEGPAGLTGFGAGRLPGSGDIESSEARERCRSLRFGGVSAEGGYLQRPSCRCAISFAAGISGVVDHA